MSKKPPKMYKSSQEKRIHHRNYFHTKAPRPPNITKVDPKCQEATPEILRIEIDQIFKTFIDDPQLDEYIFPCDLNNLQRKYIHHKAQKMNIISKSHGREPNRQLHIRKKNKQLSCQCFTLTPCQITNYCLEEFANAPTLFRNHTEHFRIKHSDRFIGNKLVNGPATVPKYLTMTEEIDEIRINLPIYEQRNVIIETIRNNQIVVISSETGSGKTTQVPQYIMEDCSERKEHCKIICTQPRRISTVAAAERVAYERMDCLGASVGYHIRLEQKYGINTNLIYCTTGVFLRNLMNGPSGLRNITHIIIDEVHERDKLSDFLLICLKQFLTTNTKLKIILMSATVNTGKFLNYFGVGEVLTIPGRLFAIDVMFLEQVLVLAKYMSPQMKDAQKAELESQKYKQLRDASIANIEENNAVDEALDEYLNFSDNYDYRVHYEEATAQLQMYFLSEGVSVDYQHSVTGKTALMIAATLGDKEFITRLCNMGANMDMACCMGKTALEYASDKPEIIRHLSYIRDRNVTDEKDGDQSKEGERLLKLYDKTTLDDIIDYELIVTLIKFIHKSGQPGSILVFLPGYDDIMICNDYVLSGNLAPSSYQVFFLHGSMNVRDQHNIFKKLPNKRKIILSTNIAETSITIEDVVFVIDTGKAKEKCYDSYNKVSSLQTHWIAQACAKQRMGRAGRTRPGMCFRLYSQQRYDNMDAERVPEILRVSLEELCLHTKVLAPEGMNIHNFLSMAPDAPSANSIKVAIENLQYLGALDKEEDLTVLGEYLAQLTIEPHLGKMLLYSVIFRCLEPILTLTAAMAHKDPFQLPPQANLKSYAAEKRRELVEGVMSDHVLYLQVFKMWQKNSCSGKAAQFCRDFYISHPTMNSILETRSQLLGQLRAAGFVHQSNSIDEYNRNAHCWPMVKAIICTGCYPNLAFPLGQHLATRTEKKVNVQASSVCSNKKFTTWLVFDEMIKHRNILLIRGVTAVTTMTVALMCGNDIISPDPNTLNIDEWLEFDFPNGNCVHLRSSADRLIERVLEHPQYHYDDHDYLTVDTLREVLNAEEAYADLVAPCDVGEKPRFFFPQNDFVRRTGQNVSERSLTGGMGARRYKGQISPGKHQRENQKRYVSRATTSFHQMKSYGGEPSNVQLVSQSIENLDLSPRQISRQKLLNGHTNPFGPSSSIVEKFGDYLDSKIFILIKPKQKKNVEIAQWTFKWIFAPHTEKKILYYSSMRKPVYLIFTVYQCFSFQGIAKYISIYNEPSGKPTANIDWLYKDDLPHIQTRHLKNPYNGYKPVYEGVDGQIVQENVAEELMRIYKGTTKSHTREVP